MPQAENIAAAVAMLEAADPVAATTETPAAAESGVSEVAPEAAVEKTPAQLRAEKLSAQLEELRARKQDRVARAARSTHEQDIARQRAEIQRDQEQARAERERWTGVDKDPIAAFKALGLDPGEQFMKLSKAAQEANDPAALARLATERAAAVEQQFRDYVQKQEQERHQVAAEREREQAENGLLQSMPRDTHPYANAYLDAAEIRKVGHMIADQQRARGLTPSFESVSKEIESRAKEHHLSVTSALGQGIESGQSSVAQAATGNTKGNATQGRTATSTLTNELASTTASNPSRRKTLAERQKEAAAMLSAPVPARK